MYPSPHVRVSDADREAIVARLSTATAEGRLTIEEFSERSRYAYAARTWGELSSVLHDLPALVAPPAVLAQPPVRESKVPMLSLVFGLLSLPLFMCTGGLLAPFSALAAIVLGVQALRGPARTVLHGRGMAIAGLTLGTVSMLGTATVLTLLINGSEFF